MTAVCSEYFAIYTPQGIGRFAKWAVGARSGAYLLKRVVPRDFLYKTSQTSIQPKLFPHSPAQNKVALNPSSFQKNPSANQTRTQPKAQTKLGFNTQTFARG